MNMRVTLAHGRRDGRRPPYLVIGLGLGLGFGFGFRFGFRFGFGFGLGLGIGLDLGLGLGQHTYAAWPLHLMLGQPVVIGVGCWVRGRVGDLG